eukprot:CAMPEP_0176490386 /NCGR_PEP_ID=MMETSP0200_2-20121128/7839_1 /TAXON_ID=947934 /ORGANISM="Chaetoceros sp., Strain GSL56" /LENGTH=349 /DNA_ID=CAMNT_0017887681 /DNA_START=704 /DNA_END=1753 /DNA_ORIENTATION=+
MKRAGTDKKYAHALGEKYQSEILAEESEFTNLQRLQKLASTYNTDATSSPAERGHGPGGHGTGTVRQLSAPPSPKAKRVRIDIPQGRRPRSQSTGALPLPPIGKIPKASAMRSRSDSYDLNSSIINNFPYSNSPLGDFHDSSTQRLMTDLILTLNASFPDYDFSNVKPSEFARVPSSNVAMNRTNERLSELAACSAQGDRFLSDLWGAIDDVIVLKDCEVYSYVPPSKDDDDDPLGFLSDSLDGTDSAMPLWTFNFFFVNKNLKRIVLFTCVQTMRTELGVDETTEDVDDDSSIVKDSADFGSPGRILRTGSSRFDGNSAIDDEDGGGLDYDMDADGMNQAVAPPATVA